MAGTLLATVKSCMIPYYFGSSGRRLFGCYHPPLVGGKRLGIVLCNPLGPEYFPAHRTVRFLARMLAERGIHVLRFDYYGTGDSDGTEVVANTESYVSDVAVALEELREASGVASVGLLGIRGGAEVAARASETDEGMARLVLWDPVAHHLQRDREDPPVGARHSLVRKRTPILLVSTRLEPDAYRPIVDALTRWGGAPSLIHAPAAPYWSDVGAGSGGLPVAAVQEAVEWLAN